MPEPVVAECPACGHPLSETSVLALAPVCNYCKSVITKTGGTLGLTGAYGVNDPTITRRRAEADLAVLIEYREKYRGAKEAFLQQLDWGVERYAKLPQPPQLLAVEPVPSFWKGLWVVFGALAGGSLIAVLWFVVSYIAAYIVMGAWWLFKKSFKWSINRSLINTPRHWFEPFSFMYLTWCHGRMEPENLILNMLVCGVPFLIVCYFLLRSFFASILPHFRAKKANGERPRENARRQKAYEQDVAAALKAAEPLKAAEDYRLRVRIREEEALYETFGEKVKEVQKLLATL